MPQLLETTQYFTTILNVGGGITNAQTTGIIIADVSGIDTSKPGIALLDYSTPLNTALCEWIEYTSINGSKEFVGVTRGAEGFSAKSHSNSVSVAFPISESHINRLVNAVSKVYEPVGNTLLKATATEVATGTDDTKIVTPLAAVPYSNNSMARQAIINGNFDVWQRGTSIAWAASVYTADRWLFTTGSGQAGTVTRQDGTAVVGSQYSMRVQRTAGQLASNNEMYYAMETADSIKLRGKKLTLTFWAKCGANFSPTSSYLPVSIVTGKGTDQKVASFTSSAVAVSANNVLTTSYQKFTLTTSAVIASDITQIGLNISNYTTGTAGANDWFEITQVQLCAGDVPLPFMPKSFDEELRACMRYCNQIDGLIDVAVTSSQTTTGAFVQIIHPVPMRVLPSLENSTITGSAFSIIANNNVQNITGMSVSNSGAKITCLQLSCSGAGLISREAGIFRIATSNYIRLVAEL